MLLHLAGNVCRDWGLIKKLGLLVWAYANHYIFFHLIHASVIDIVYVLMFDFLLSIDWENMILIFLLAGYNWILKKPCKVSEENVWPGCSVSSPGWNNRVFNVSMHALCYSLYYHMLTFQVPHHDNNNRHNILNFLVFIVIFLSLLFTDFWLVLSTGWLDQ